MRDKQEGKAGWANIHEDGSKEMWPSKELAEKNLTRGTVACIRGERETAQGNKPERGED